MKYLILLFLTSASFASVQCPTSGTCDINLTFTVENNNNQVLTEDTNNIPTESITNDYKRMYDI